MIDEKRVREMGEHFLEVFDLNRAQAPAEGKEFDDELRAEWAEVFRLARLGLWAERHGIVAMKTAVNSLEVAAKVSPWQGASARIPLKEALAALPKEEK